MYDRSGSHRCSGVSILSLPVSLNVNYISSTCELSLIDVVELATNVKFSL